MKTNNLTEKAAETARDVQEKAREIKDNARDWSREAAATARTKMRDAQAAADLYVHENTWTTIALVAVSAGLIGFLLGRRDY